MSSEPPKRGPDLVIPSLGRPTLWRLLAALAPQRGALGRILVVDDRRTAGEPLELPPFVETVPGPARGPAAARNTGWRVSEAEWVAFLDDDVVPDPDWARRLRDDLEAAAAGVAASQGRLRVPLATGRPPTDWERNVAALERAAWISADLAVRRSALESAGGFDERFGGAYREDTDFAMRLLRCGWRIASGRRRVSHPVSAAGFWISVARQRGNADDILMRALHGRHWRRWGRAPRGRLRRHLLTTVSLAAAVTALAVDRRRSAAALAAGWFGLTAELAWARIAPGPRDRDEVVRMLATSAALSVAAALWSAWGVVRLPVLLARGGPRGDGSEPPAEAPAAVLFDRDGTLVLDVPYNGDPAKVVAVPGARRALRRLREVGTSLAVISNQSGVRRGLIAPEQVEAVNRRAEELLGPIGPWFYCPHGPGDGCECRKPEPGLVLAAAERLGVPPDRCAVVGDVAADVQAAQAAGAAAVLVPTPRTEAEDVRRAPRTATSIEAAVEWLIGGNR
ncbi:MAG TPA: HAD-IIIA family hydrolase [Solirubrobacterales bacterium]|nr:HAD-IIIA family hydrolase [Solirubrobacterales bacterium]